MFSASSVQHEVLIAALLSAILCGLHELRHILQKRIALFGTGVQNTSYTIWCIRCGPDVRNMKAFLKSA